VERWAELRRQHFVGGKSIKQLARKSGLSRNTIRGVLRSKQPPVYRNLTPSGWLAELSEAVPMLVAKRIQHRPDRLP
jgi:uncharacterized protein YidB (DUF937 family)